MKESEIQKAVFRHIKERAVPGVIAWAVPNTPQARRVPGYLAGVHDVSIVKGLEFFSLELKTEDGTASPEQEQHCRTLNDFGCSAYIAYGLDDALAWLELQGIIRRAS